MVGVLGGVDAIVFTGGIGENSARVRRDAAGALRFAGLELAEDANASGKADRDIAAPESRVHVLVVRAREDLAILEDVLRLLDAERPGSDTPAGSLHA
jgi:acetate kinase